ncbi:MAG: hypothetical protein ABW252_22570 [Polyangiales bacterium]
MRPALWLSLFLTLSLPRMHAHAQASAIGTTRSFVGCAIYRDTDLGRKSGCWLVDDPADGSRFDVSFAPNKPREGQAVWVEGVVTADPDLCGGTVLKAVRVSVLPAPCPVVRVPPEGHKGRPSPPPVDVLPPTRVPRTLPPPPYEPRTFTIYFEHGRDFLIYQHAEVVLEKAQLYAQASGARSVAITGFAATEPLVISGHTLAEDLVLAEARAAMAAEALRRLGVPPALLRISVAGAPAPTDLENGKLPESSKRRVTITVTP